MMISPEAYYECHLKRKSETQLLTAIRGLKNEIGHLKNLLEHPDYNLMPHTKPSESTRLRCTRLYLDRAKEAYAEAGGHYVPSQAELKAQVFQDSIPFIGRIIFTIGGYWGGYETRTFTIGDEHLYMDIDHSIMQKPSNFHIEPDYLMTKEEFLDGLCNLHLGEWRSSYTTTRYGIIVNDGTQWNLEIQYSDGRKSFKVYGDNAYPFNFVEFQDLLGVDPSSEETEDD